MRKEEARTDLGIIRIHNDAISAIASIAACEVVGVQGVGRNWMTLIMDLLGKKNPTAIRIDVDKAGQVTLEIPLVIKYGYNIADISEKVQKNVHDALEKMSSLYIKEINIKVKRIVRE